jgi:RNA polymerase sigma-70 factor (ECF subfamily)
VGAGLEAGVSEQKMWDFESDELPFQAQLHKRALRLTRSPEHAEDLLQDTYLKAYRHYRTFRPGTSLRAWLFTILKNTFINDYRRRKAARAMVAFEHMEDWQESTLLPVYGTPGRTPEDEMVEQSLDSEVRQALAELPAPYRIVVLLADIEGHTYKTIATILSIPVGTVMSRLYRGRRFLEQALLSFGVRQNYLNRRPHRLRSRNLDLEQLFGVATTTTGAQQHALQAWSQPAPQEGTHTFRSEGAGIAGGTP